jgi:flagellar basal-body rod modification protein FlgD
MNISGIESAAPASAASVVPEAQILGKEDFLSLLIAQLQHQDPLEPTDSVEFTAQLAQFSSLEQLGNVNDNLEKLELYQASINNSQAVSFIGKEIVARGDGIKVTDGGPVACQFDLPGEAGSVTVSIYDATGEFVRTFDAPNLSAGLQALVWDAKDQNGNLVPDGVYRFELMAENPEGEPMAATTYASGQVSGVTFSDNATYLITNERKIPAGDVIQVNDVPKAQPAKQQD